MVALDSSLTLAFAVFDVVLALALALALTLARVREYAHPTRCRWRSNARSLDSPLPLRSSRATSRATFRATSCAASRATSCTTSRALPDT